MTKATVYGMNCKATITFPAWQYPPKKKSPSEFGGQRHLRYIRQHRKALYTELLTGGRLNTYLADVNDQAEEQMLLLTQQMDEREGITEELKAQDQMLWVQRMDNIQGRAMEFVNHDLRTV